MIILGLAFTISTSLITARTESPFLKKSAGICSVLGNNNSFPSSSNTKVSFFQTWYTSPLTISPTRSLYFLNISSFSNSNTLETKVWRAAKIALRPKLSKVICSMNSSPTSMSGSIFLTSANSISKSSSSEKPSSITIRVRQISKSPLSGFTITSQFSSVPKRLRNMLRNTSSNTLITVGRSMFLKSLNSWKESIKLMLLILFK